MEFKISDKMRNMKPSIIREILKQMSDPTLISFAGGNPAADSFPAEDIARFSDELLRQDPVAALQYSVSEGVPSVREAVRAFANRRERVAKENDGVLITSGSQQILDFAAKCLCNEGDVVAVENPAFLGAFNAFRSSGARLAGVPMEDDGVNLAALEAVFAAPEKPRFFYCIPNFQNPTGKTMSLAKRRAVYALAVRYGVPVLEDDPYGELRIAGEPVPSIKSMDTEGAVIYAGSFSKILCPGMRLAYCVCDKKLMAAFVVAKQCSDVHTNVWAQRVCEAMLTRTDMDAHIREIRKIYAAKAALMMEQLDEKCPQVRYTRPEGGMFIWGTLPEGADMPAFVRECLARKLALVPGNAFMVDEEAPCGSFRMNFHPHAGEHREGCFRYGRGACRAGALTCRRDKTNQSGAPFQRERRSGFLISRSARLTAPAPRRGPCACTACIGCPPCRTSVCWRSRNRNPRICPRNR